MKCKEKGCQPKYYKKDDMHFFKCMKCGMMEYHKNDKTLQENWNKKIFEKRGKW